MTKLANMLLSSSEGAGDEVAFTNKENDKILISRSYVEFHFIFSLDGINAFR